MNLTDLEDMEEDFAYLQIGEVFARGEILVPGAVTRAMGWEPGTELMASRTSEMLIVQEFLPRCMICGFLKMSGKYWINFSVGIALSWQKRCPFIMKKRSI